MIDISVNEPKFEYDIQALVKSFYPNETVRVILVSDDTKTKFSVVYTDGNFSFAENEGAFNKTVEVPEGTERVEQKNILKRLIYGELSKYLQKELVWGDLSGIRPTKIAMKKVEEGAKDEEIKAYMKKTYLVSDEKCDLAIGIARREKEILSSIHYKGGYSIYIGIPFCPTTCLYCSFTSNPIAMFKDYVDDFLRALFKEIDYIKNSKKNQILDTIYIGGGTPTTLTAQQLEKLLSKLAESFDLSTLLEFTVEAGRADSITLEKMKVLKKYGVTRISVNPQTMNQKTLDIIGRRHTTKDVERAFEEAREAGIDNINMDIILGLPQEGTSEVLHTIEEIEKMSPESLTVHSLAIKRASKLSEWIEKNGYETMINTDETMKIAADGAARMDMKPYYLYRQKNMAGNFENTGYAKEGKYGIYNILIMEEVQSIVACGPATVTKRVYDDGSIKRCDDVKELNLYIERIDEMIDRKKTLFED